MTAKVVIADDKVITRIDLKERLESHGYEVVGQASDGFGAIEICRETAPDLVLLDIKMPMLDGLSAAKVINEENLCNCIIMLTAYSDNEFIEIANSRGVMGYIVKPIDDKILLPTIKIALKRSEEIAKLKKDLQEKDVKIEERKFIEKAKGLLMKKNKISEHEAYEYMRMISMSKRMPMKKVAELILISYENLN